MAAHDEVKRAALGCDTNPLDRAGNANVLDAIVHSHALRFTAANPDAMREMKRTSWRHTEDWEAQMSERAAMSGRIVLSDITREAPAKSRAR